VLWQLRELISLIRFELTMAEELSGEHKLRIVLESILRNIPREEQCKKYGISEDVFQEWHDHLITNGGKIFDPDFGKTRTRVRKVHRLLADDGWRDYDASRRAACRRHPESRCGHIYATEQRTDRQCSCPEVR